MISPMLTFNDYKATLNLKYQCTLIKMTNLTSGAAMAISMMRRVMCLQSTPLCQPLAKGRVYHSEFHVRGLRAPLSLEYYI